MSAPKLPERPSGPGSMRNPRPSYRRALWLGISVSAALHVLVILLYSLGFREWGPRAGTVEVQSTSRPFSGMRVVRVVEISSPATLPDAVREELPVPVRAAEDRSPEVPAGPADDEVVGDEAGEADGAVRAAEILRVTSSDTRLWRAALPEMFELTEAERLQLELAGRLEAWHDSVALALAAESALTDWTMTDDEGNRWGISKGKLHLGSLTLPLPVAFGGTTWERERATRRAWEDADILNNVNSQAARASWGERAKAIRERKDRQRREAESQPDTSRVSPSGSPP